MGCGSKGGCATVAVAFQQNSRDEVRVMGGDGQVAGAIAAEPGMKQQNYICADVAQPVRSNPYNNSDPGLDAAMHIRQGMQVRRLTSVECERLMGFPDNFTNIPWKLWQTCQSKGWSYEAELVKRGKTLKGCTVDDCPDGPRYKALGNSMAVPCMVFIGNRIRDVVSRTC
jgi:DNA (cytosine-5)-methyltransferase 1